jgi:clan AA aspartic protease
MFGTGNVMAKIKLQNSFDLAKFREGTLRRHQVRALETEGRVSTGATLLVIPEEVAAFLGLPTVDKRRIMLADGRIRSFPVVGDLRIEVLGRDMSTDAVVMPIGTTILIGRVVLETLDLVVDPRSRDVFVNPAQPDGPLAEALTAA